MNVSSSSAETTADFEYELDAYYSNISWVKGFDNRDVPLISNLDEIGIYQDLLKKSFTPDFLLFEASINPMPILGVYIRENHPSLYGRENSNLNLVSALTAGFDEPFALSVFAGNIVRFAPPEGLKTEGDDKGYIGYLLSVGSQHIQRSKLINDDWAEFEVKVKGKRTTAVQHLSWSLRAGAKFHDHPDIENTYMMGLRRERIDYTRGKDSYLRDLSFEYRLDLLQKNFNPSRQQLIIDKHWPLAKDKLTFSLGFGLIWQNDELYSGALVQPPQKWSFILRPNILF